MGGKGTLCMEIGYGKLAVDNYALFLIDFEEDAENGGSRQVKLLGKVWICILFIFLIIT